MEIIKVCKISLKKVLFRLIKHLHSEKFRCTYCGKLYLYIPLSHKKECRHSPNGRHNFIVVHK